MIVYLNRSNGNPLSAGPGEPTRVMALFGANSTNAFESQAQKLYALSAMSERPDLVADLSIVQTRAKPLWKLAVESGLVASTLPIYTVKRERGRIDRNELLDVALAQIEGGVGLITIHPTATRELVDAAQRRIVPWTSRGGGLVIADLAVSNRAENVYRSILSELVSAARRHRTVLSIGATFRSSNIFDSMDGVQQAEIAAQIELAKEISGSGVGVIIESPGHARPADIGRCARLLAPTGFPVMPLGPIPTDIAIGWDHVAAAIGATLMGIEGAAHILAAVTREEHTGNLPTLESTLEAVHAARVAAHIIDIHVLGLTNADFQVVTDRAEHHTCIAGKVTSGCSRCSTTCPLEIQ